MRLIKKYFPISCIIATLFASATLPAQMDLVNFGYQRLFPGAFDIINRDTQPNLDESYKVLQIIHEKALPGVDFRLQWDPILLPYYENLEIGSAMALDFLARYINECSNLKENEIIQHVKEFESYYSVQTPTFVARDHAFENVNFSDPFNVDPEIVKYRKLQSVANYHDIHLKPVTNSLKKKDIKKGNVKLEKIIDNLPISTYVIRALDPSIDSKEDGNTIILIKNKNFSIFYECANGASIIKNKASGKWDIKPGEFITEYLIESPFSEFRLYKATCAEETCANLK